MYIELNAKYRLFISDFNETWISEWVRKLDEEWSGRNEIIETSGRLHPLWPQDKWLHTPRTTDYRHTRQDRWIRTELVSTFAKNAIILLQTTRKENNWKTEETLERAVVTLETERIKGSNHWCLCWDDDDEFSKNTVGRTDRQTGMTKLIISFRSFANAPKSDPCPALQPRMNELWIFHHVTCNQLSHWDQTGHSFIHDSPVGTVPRSPVGRWSEFWFSAPKCPDRLWDPPCFLCWADQTLCSKR